MTFIAAVFGVFLLAALMVLGAIKLYARRPSRDVEADQSLYPLAFMTGAVAMFSAVGLAATGIVALVTKVFS